MNKFNITYEIEGTTLYIYDGGEIISEITDIEELTDIDAEILISEMCDQDYFPTECVLAEVQAYLS